MHLFGVSQGFSLKKYYVKVNNLMLIQQDSLEEVFPYQYDNMILPQIIMLS